MYNDEIKEILQNQDVKIEKTTYALDQKMIKFDPRKYDLMSKLQFEESWNTFMVKNDNIVKRIDEKTQDLDNRTDGIDMDMVKIQDKFEEF